MNNILDLHTHSVLSTHAYSTLYENICFARKAGLKYYGISEHQYDDKGVGAHPYAFLNIDTLPRYYEGMMILRGIELNIRDEGFDISKINMNKFDYCIASMHHYAYSNRHSVEENTANYLKACQQPFVNILGHIDGDDYPVDYEAVVIECKKTNTLIELNNNSLRPNSSRKGALQIDRLILKLCQQYKQPIIIGSDAHICFDVGRTDRAFALLEECDFPKELVLNLNEELFLNYLNICNK